MSYLKEISFKELVHYFNSMETESYSYTAGNLGEEFLKKIKDEGKIYSANCNNCKINFLPVRSFCLFCGNEVKELKEIKQEGKIESFSLVKINNKNETLGKPKILAYIKFGNTVGGLLHFIDEIEYKNLKIGMKVIPIFKEKNERKGSLEDIKYFKPL